MIWGDIVDNRALGRCLVTGATGFVGRRLVRRLEREGLEVRAFDLPGTRLSKRAKAQLVEGDIRDPDSVGRAAEGVQTIFHLAAFIGDYGPWALHEAVTVRGTQNIIDAAYRTGARVIVTSSICAYGDAIQQGPVNETTRRGAPQSHYDRAKQAQEDVALRGDADAIVIRPANIIGAGSGPWVLSMAEAIRAGRPSVIGKGKGDAGLLYIENLLDILIAAAEIDTPPARIFNAADRYGVTWRQYAEDLARLVGAPAPKSVPRKTAWALAYAADAAWRVSRRNDRPHLTKSTVNLCGYPNLIDMTRTDEILGPLRPRPYTEALLEIAEFLDKKPERRASAGRAFG